MTTTNAIGQRQGRDDIRAAGHHAVRGGRWLATSAYGTSCIGSPISTVRIACLTSGRVHETVVEGEIDEHCLSLVAQAIDEHGGRDEVIAFFLAALTSECAHAATDVRRTIADPA
ncbi:hypothetical protein [Nocardioides ferulae]|uniref:hypothetical protein n=1 Tax=Nocardioides ferulae TaxID=2340821 RepID=UPI000EB1BA71|nr:hypothetical protein [Nocardioides ferulae]